MSDFEQDDDYFDDDGFDDEEIDDEDEDGEMDDDDDENEFVDGRIITLTEEKDDGFDEEELMNDELRDDDITEYEEILEEVKEFTAGKNPYKTLKFITKYEISRIISTRATQLQHNAPPLIQLTDPKTGKILKNALEIAEEEFRQGKLPITVERPLPTKVPHKYTTESRPLSTLICDV